VLAVQLGSSSRTAWLLLVGCVVACVVFGLIWATHRDGVAAAFCVVALAGAVRMGLLLRRRHRLQTTAGMVAHGRTFASALGETLFVSFGHYTLGGRLRHGVVLIGPVSAAFVPVGAWTHVAWEAVKAPFVARFRFVDLAIDLANTGDVDAALHDAVARHDGFIIDSSWTYTHSQRWLSRPGVQGIVWIERRPPESITSRWAPAPPPSAERYRWIRNRIATVAAVVVVVLGLGGVVAWRLTGDADYLIAGLAYGLLLAGSVIGGVVLAKRRLATDHRRRH
jgi:hypothetical protein